MFKRVIPTILELAQISHIFEELQVPFSLQERVIAANGFSGIK